ncbi:MAG: SPOR domain-containing protein [Betaproteobacteria bacterium]|nr:SPOR domain-containing protein [Betaproteobacteria bacterium]
MPNVDDAQLQKKARHRLIGAVVFVSIAAFALLLAMDAEPPDTTTLTLTIPSQDGAEVLPLDGSLALPHTSPPPPESAPPVPPLTTPAVTPSPPATQPSPPAAVVHAEPPRPATVTATTPAAASRPAPDPAASKPAPNPASTPTTPKPAAPVANPAIQDANRAAAILAGRSPETANHGTPQPVTNTASSYIVQVIASSNTVAIQETVEKLRALKLPVYTETASGNMTRVRVGPYATRIEAERAEAKINQDGKIADTKIYPQSPSPR